MWRKGTDQILKVEGRCPALGMVPDFEYVQITPFRLEPGDAMILYTDGLTEARSHADTSSLYGIERLGAVLKTCAPDATSARDLAEAVAKAVDSFAGGKREDDMTVVVLLRS